MNLGRHVFNACELFDHCTLVKKYTVNYKK